jgi:hypothetical protein
MWASSRAEPRPDAIRLLSSWRARSERWTRFCGLMAARRTTRAGSAHQLWRSTRRVAPCISNSATAPRPQSGGHHSPNRLGFLLVARGLLLHQQLH